MSRKEYFEDRRSRFKSESDEHETKLKGISYVRVVIIIMAVVLLVFFANERNGLLITVVAIVAPIVFGIFVKQYNKIRRLRDKARILSDLNNRELERAALTLREFEGGDHFSSVEHDYSADLDLFGKHSLYQLLNRTTTSMGGANLANWMLNPSDRQEILHRQSAVRELLDKPEWIQEFEAEGLLSGDEQKNVDTLLNWLETDESGFFTMKNIWAGILGLVTVGFLTLVFSGSLSYGFLMFPLGLNIIVLGRVFGRLKDLMEITYEGAKAIKGYRRLIEIIDSTSFSSERLIQIHSRFSNDELKAPEAIKKLDKLLDVLNSRANAFYALINLSLLTDFFLFNGLIKWKKEYGSSVRTWFSSMAEVETYNSLAGFSYANETYAYPEISESEFEFSAMGLGHPLIPSESRVENDVSIRGKGRVVVVTGSNMSGKSTFLRTVGTNIVLSYLGSPVCASSMNTSPLDLFTSMRTADKLEESISSFYAELKRLKGLIEKVENGDKPIMYMVDEVLKGTNSSDRHLGAKSLIKQLTGTHSFGWISTHDLALGELEKESEVVSNMSFNSKLIGDDLVFDYKLTPGICETFNASVLMKKMGIRLIEET